MKKFKIFTILAFVVSTLLCVSAAAAYSQDCNSYLRQATELLSHKKYCDAKSYYLKYKNCNADADVSTEIAMCERLCKINVMLEEEDEPVVTEEKTVVAQERNDTSSTSVSAVPDIIMLNNGEEIHAIVLEVGNTDVKYKKFDYSNDANNTLKKSKNFTDDSICTILKSEIASILYQNGEVETFETESTTPYSTTQKTQLSNSPLENGDV